MFYTILDDLIYYQLLYFLKRYSNFELKLHNYFYDKTNLYPTYINVIKIEELEYIFFFVKKESYFEANDLSGFYEISVLFLKDFSEPEYDPNMLEELEKKVK